MEKKNTILLTVIAVATLLVAVVGATFAYFTAQGGTTSQANISVSTGTAGSSTLSTFDAINIYADATNFAENAGNRTGTTTGTVSWTAPGAVAGQAAPSEADRSFCYTAALNVAKNDFNYSSTNTTHAAELTLTAKKNDTVVLEDKDITVGTAAVNIPTEKDGSTMTHKLLADAGATKSDKWELTVTLVNLGVDQNDNTTKQFSGAVKFTKTNCE